MQPADMPIFTRANATWQRRFLAEYHYAAYDSTRQYAINDITENGGSVWKALTSNLGVTPVEGANWTKIARPRWDFTGGTLRAMVRKTEPAHEVQIEVWSGAEGNDDNGIQINDMDNGDFQVEFAQERLERMPAGDYVWDLVFERPDGTIDPLMAGSVTHVTGVTRDAA